MRGGGKEQQGNDTDTDCDPDTDNHSFIRGPLPQPGGFSFPHSRTLSQSVQGFAGNEGLGEGGKVRTRGMQSVRLRQVRDAVERGPYRGFDGGAIVGESVRLRGE